MEVCWTRSHWEASYRLQGTLWAPHPEALGRQMGPWCSGAELSLSSSRVGEGASEVAVSDSRAASELYLQATAGEGR